jgi:predicted Zn-dependent protease
MSQSKNYKLRFRDVSQLRDQGDADGAIRVLRQLIAEFPEKVAAYLIIGDILWDESKLAQASKQFRTATKRFPKSKIASLGLFHTLWQQSKTDAALDEIKRFQSVSFCSDYEEIINEILHEA